MSIGSTDNSIEQLSEDLFDISQYVKGLSDFIKVCVTPMTISIQGDWGSGKTSIMNMVRNNLQNDVITVWFNTWQYSQFNMGDELAISFLRNIIKVLDVEKAANENKISETLKKVGAAVKKTGLIVIDHYGGGMAADELNKLSNKLFGENNDITDSIENLKKEFENSIDQKLKKENKDRMVVFIDDLDRLNPKKAVELLEVLKIFLDCEKCIFVLAIDYNVVCQGVKEKYGNLINEDKGKSFFDKIIQVPFKMPVTHYKLNLFVTKMLKQVNINAASDESNDYVELIQASVGCNPRTMKRLFNAYLLLTYISKNVGLNVLLDDTEQGMWYKKILFGILCCQHAYEDLYNFLIANYTDFLESDLLKAMCNKDTYIKQNAENSDDEEKEEFKLLTDAFKGKTDDYLQKISYFMTLFAKIIDRDNNQELNNDELEGFVELLKLTTITSAGNDSMEAENSLQKEYRIFTRQIMTLVAKNVSPVIKALNPNNKLNPVYQINRDSDTFKSTWAEVWAYITIKEHGQIWFESTLTVDLETGGLGLQIWTRRRKNFPKSDYTEYFSESPLIKEKNFIWNENPYGIKKVLENIGKISAEKEEQKIIAEKVSGIMKEYLELL